MKKTFYSNTLAYYGSILLIFKSLGCKKDKLMTEVSVPLFSLLPPEETQIHFQNSLTEGLNTNILMYEYLYNGGGVATGDVNGDGLIDIYFSANMSNNALYLNTGSMKFDDITQIARVSGRPGPWKTGVAIVDVNGDHKLDIYVCYSGALPEHKRKNQLFINQGNNADGIPIFSEKAEVYGLDSPAYSNQTYFFDYDKDGDLDLLLLNHNPQSLPVLNEVSTARILKEDHPFIGVRLYRQTQQFFEDVTQISGISSSALTYGLGIGISDLDNDGWQDIYISNDYAVPDYLYYNNKDGTFTNRIQKDIGHTSHFSMGNDIADINNDGWQDIITLDMLPEDNYRQKLLLAPDNYEKFDLNIRSGFHYQYMRNMLQLNNQNGTFSEIGQLAGISNTDWSWAVLTADYDNDGWKDLFITNGYYRDYTNLDFINYMDTYVKSKGRLKREDVMEIIKKMPSSDLVNYFFLNDQGLHFSNKSLAVGLHHQANSNGAAYADLDNDGDLDLIINNINQPAFIYQNNSRELTNRNYLQIILEGETQNTQGIGAKINLFSHNKKQSLEQATSRGYLSSISPVLHFGLGKENTIDSLIITWNSGKHQKLSNVKVNQRLKLVEKDAVTTVEQNTDQDNSSSIFKKTHPLITYKNPKLQENDFKRQPLLISQLSTSGPCMTKGDINNDGLEDVFIGGAKDQAASLFIQQKNTHFIKKTIVVFENDSAAEDAAAAIFDANGDGHADIYVVGGGYHHYDKHDDALQDRLYLNDGKGNFFKSKNTLPRLVGSKSCIAVHDIDEDGALDLFIGGRVVPGRYPETPRSYILMNDGKGHFTDKTHKIAPELQTIGMVTDALWADLNNDTKFELIIVGEWMPISIYAIKDHQLHNETTSYFKTPYNGWWNTITAADVNLDGKPDLIAGNVGRNTQFRVSEEEPASLYFKDFDKNGAVDPLFCYYIQGKSYPYITRDELLGQLSHLRSRFTSYKSYANASLTDIFSPKDLKNAQKLMVNHMETTLFCSTTQNGFQLQPLPVEAQYAPVNAIIASDFTTDGKPDLLLLGNNHHFKLRLGRSDANYGILLSGNGKGNFNYIGQPKSGLNIQGQVNSVLHIDKHLFIGIHQDSIQTYTYDQNTP